MLIAVPMLVAICLILPGIGNAAPPAIYSIEPNFGATAAQATITIKGSGFSSTPMVSLYGGGPYITGFCDTPGDAQGVYVAGKYAYVADGSSGLQVIDITNPAHPAIVGSWDTPYSAVDVQLAGTYVYVVPNFDGLAKSHITHRGSYKTFSYCWQGVFHKHAA